MWTRRENKTRFVYFIETEIEGPSSIKCFVVIYLCGSALDWMLQTGDGKQQFHPNATFLTYSINMLC